VGSARYLQGLGFKALATTGGAQGRAQLREEFRHAIGELTDAFGAEIAALERRLKAVPGRLPVAKDWIQESVTYQAEFVWRALASAQGHRTGPRRLGLGLRRTRWP
jgi:hypothetical protein